MQHSFTEENYIKTIFQLTKQNTAASTNDIAKELETKASSVTDMLKKLSDKNLVNYVKYKGVTLTKSGEKLALVLIRKHRLWECFLVNKLNFQWHQVHEIAEELEHINSEELINRLDDFLGNPKFDPHGDPIPDKNLKLAEKKNQIHLLDLSIGDKAIVTGVSNTDDTFLKYLNDLDISLGSQIECTQKFDFDNTIKIKVNKQEIMLSEKVSQSIIINTL